MRIINDITLMGRLLPKYLDLPEADNQGILGLEVKYDEYLQGTNGKNPHVNRCEGELRSRMPGRAD